jgi:glutathione S-transferase
MAAKILAAEVSQRDYLAGAFSVADILAGHTLLWARSARLNIESDALDNYLRRLESREALKRAQSRA